MAVAASNVQWHFTLTMALMAEWLRLVQRDVISIGAQITVQKAGTDQYTILFYHFAFCRIS